LLHLEDDDMRRQPLTEPAGHWFDLDTAETFNESTWHDGNNFISHATGSQWSHETLYRTASGSWVLNHWSQYQGSGETWTEIGDDEAARWLVQNNHDHPDAAGAIESFEI
jgi:hypothetical protein